MLPFEFRFERRLQVAPWLGPSLPIVAILVALLFGAVILWATGRDPIAGYSALFQTAFTRPGALTATILSATPLIFTGLAAALAFRISVWNIGGDGQLMIGALTAATAGVAFGHLGGWISTPLMIIAGALGGALWGLVPAYFRARSGTNEVLTTLMLNYLAPLLLAYLIFSSRSWWRDLSSSSAKVFPKAKSIPYEAFWPAWGTEVIIPLGFVLGIALAVLIQIVLHTTKYGFEVLVTADSPRAGNYAGIRTRRVFITIFLMSAALAGLGGASQIGDFTYQLEPRVLQSAAFGYTGIAVAALARYNPIGVVAAAVFVGGLVNANLSLQGPDLPLGLLGVIQGMILLFVAASEISARYRIVAHRRVNPVDPVAATEAANTGVSS